VPVAQRYKNLSVPELEQLVADRTTQQGELQKALASANSMTIAAQTRPERAQAEISTSQTRIQQINTTLKLGRDNGKLLTQDQRNQLTAEAAALTCADCRCAVRSWRATACCKTSAAASMTCCWKKPRARTKRSRTCKP
jgi:hypothetical protein